jgi:hypothetical protein
MDPDEALELFQKILSAKHPNPEQAIKEVERRVLSKAETHSGTDTRDIEASLTEEFISLIRATANDVLQDAERVFSKPGMPLDNRTKSDLKRAVWQEPARLISFAEYALRRIVMGHQTNPRGQTLHGKFEHWRHLCDAEIDLLFNAGSAGTVQQRLVHSGEFFEANLILRRIFETARTQIDVIDPYVGFRMLVLLSVMRDAVKIRIIHNPVHTKAADIQALRDFKKQFGSVEVKVLQGDLHDRFIIVDNTTAYTLGHSLKDLGSKDTVITLAPDSLPIIELFKKRWQQATNNPNF